MENTIMQSAKNCSSVQMAGEAMVVETEAGNSFCRDLADEIGITITVCHFPPGTSKWNKIEHCMFSFISMNWRGKPLTSYETIIKLIGSTKTKKGLRIEARLDEKDYEKGKKILDDNMAPLKIIFHELYPNWNYSIEPRTNLSRSRIIE